MDLIAQKYRSGYIIQINDIREWQNVIANKVLVISSVWAPSLKYTLLFLGQFIFFLSVFIFFDKTYLQKPHCITIENISSSKT